jgi:hypothetical protein
LKIAHQFIGGEEIYNNSISPVGTIETCITDKYYRISCVTIVPTGLTLKMYIIPRDESLGYYQMSLRDKVINTEIFVKLTPMRRIGTVLSEKQ